MKNSDKKTKKEKLGLYISLAMCLLAISLAAWGTYDSLTSFIDTNSKNPVSKVESKEDDDNNVNINITARPKATTEPTQKPTEKPTQTPAPTINPTQNPTPVPTVKPIAVPPEISLGSFGFPTSNHEILREFSGETLVYNEVMKDYRLHNGVDFTATMGEDVLSANSGIVKKIYNDLLLGNVVLISYGDYDFYYCGLDKILVNEGDKVEKGTKVASIGTVPFESKTVHLHLEVKKDDNFINPLDVNFE